MATGAERQAAWRARRAGEIDELRDLANRDAGASAHRAVSRSLAAIAVTSISGHESPQQWLSRNFPSWRPQGEELAILKGVTSPSSTTGWGQELLETSIAPFLAGLAPASAAVRLFARCVRLNFAGVYQISVPRASTSAAPVFVGEGAPFPIKQDVFSSTTVGPVRKMLLGAAITGELEFMAAESATAIITRVMNEQTGRSLDAAVFDATAADSIRPPGLLNSVTPIGATAGGGLSALTTDLKNLVGAIADAGCDPDSVLFITSPELAVSLRLLPPQEFPYDVLSTNALASGTIIALDPDGVCSGYDGLPSIDVSKDFTAHFESATPLALSVTGTPNVISAPVVSGFQQRLLGLKLKMNLTWGVLQPGCIQTISSATW